MVQRLDAIQAGSWQLSLGRPGEIASGQEDIAQCIRIVTTTPRGALPLLPEFGTGALDYLDLPLSEAAPSFIRETFEAIRLWEPRAVVERIVPTYIDAGIQLEIVWHPAEEATASQSTTVKL